ncbi:hypothetical protein V8F06_001164 [Rhypophila decipiens]
MVEHIFFFLLISFVDSCFYRVPLFRFGTEYRPRAMKLFELDSSFSCIRLQCMPRTRISSGMELEESTGAQRTVYRAGCLFFISSSECTRGGNRGMDQI